MPFMRPVTGPATVYSLVTLLIAGLVLALALPRLGASVRFLPVEFAQHRYFKDRVIPSDRLQVLIEYTQQSIAIHDHYRYHDALGFLYYLRALDLNTPALERRDSYNSAEAETVSTLRSSPAQPAAWMRLVTIRWILHDEPGNIVQPWRMSVFTGRTDSALLAQRIQAGLAFFPYMDEETAAMLRDQIWLAWRSQPGSLMGVIAVSDPELAVVRRLVAATDPQLITEMEAWLARFP